jgi:hypothetical protein
MTELARKLNEAVRLAIDTPPTPLAAPAPKDFAPGVQYVNGQPSTITTGATKALETEEDWQAIVAEMGVTLPEGYRLRIVEAKFDPAAWTRAAQGEDAITAAVWRYKFAVEPASAATGDADLAELHKAAKRAAKASPKPVNSLTDQKVSMVVVLGDIQAGKVDLRGGTVELLERLEVAKLDVLRQVRKIKPAELVLVDAGDAMEMFESSPSADRTNDLQLTEQIRLWRRVLWSWTADLSRLVEDLKVLAVPSNHCSVRRGKQAMADPADDYGIEVLAQVADIAAGNPDAYSHVTFWSPDKHSESLALTLVGGKILGVTHGHQKTRPEMLPQWLAGQALGRRDVGHSDILVSGHWHNLRVQTVGDDRWIFIGPTMDSGSSWYGNTTGNESAPGVLTFVVDSAGWRDLYVAWTRVGVDF